jgi:DNA-binding helix-hairpin-helix protein with protein kinase domain
MQDCFGLAVLVFQLLMNGRHPFHGCVLDGVDRTTQELVAAGAYAYSPSSRLPVRPPPGAIAPSTLGALAPLFERAFLSSTRPSALEWAEALSRFKQGLRPCKSNRRHAVFPGQSACVLCTLPRDPLPPPLGTAPGAAPDVGSIRQLLAEIARIAPPAHAAMQPAEPPIADGDRECPTQQGEPSPADVRRAEHAGFPFGTLIATLIAAAIVVALAMSGRTSGGVCVFGFGLAALVLMLAGQIARWSERSRARRYVASYAARRTAVATELMALESAERSAREFLTRVESLAPRVERLRTAAAAIEDADRRATNDLTTNAVRRFKDYWQEEQLDAFRIGTATIPGIGLERKRVLASHGIETAADVNARDIRGVPGFGPKLTEAILDWRASCVRVVARRTIPPIPSSFIDSMRQEHAIGLAKSVQGMREEFLALRDVLGNMESAGRHHAEDVSKARAAFRQARVRALDLKPR